MPQMGCGYHVCRCVFINIRFDYINCELINIIHQDQIRIKDIEGLWCFVFFTNKKPDAGRLIFRHGNWNCEIKQLSLKFNTSQNESLISLTQSGELASVQIGTLYHHGETR